ncbi:unnamed protein product [Rotaria magnacalcarata]
MGLKYFQRMGTTVEQLVIDPRSRFLEMKSLQPYSTTDEYLYAMKEDLADWLSNMYPEWRPITADSFLECLENGVLLCQHANNVNDAARKAYSLKLAPRPLSTSTLENCKYRPDARPQTFNARDNVSQFIKWSRRVVGVREVLMFESDDLILRKNEKNFLLCLLEIARYGSQFGVSVPAIIKLEDEIEREIQRDKQTEIMSFTELRRLQREENLKNTSNSSSHGKYSRLLKFVRSETLDSNSSHNSSNDTIKNSYNTFSLSHSNGANWLRQRISRIPKFTHHHHHNHSKNLHSSGDSHDSTTWSDSTITTIVPNKEQKIIPQISRTLGEGEVQTEIPTASSQLHKTVVQMTNSCCCAQQFPVIRIGEGKYRIGESGTIIFIRILRYHVMVRVGGGWDTLENYLNKHDPCRRATSHRRLEPNEFRRDMAILAIPTNTTSSYFSKVTPHGKSVTIKTEEFPLTKPSGHDTNLANAKLLITRDAHGRHHIGQITYKSEENLDQSHACPHHHVRQPSPAPKVKSARGTGRLITSSMFNKQSSPSIDQDCSSYSTTFSIETNPTNASLNEYRPYKTSSIHEQHSPSKIINDNYKENQPRIKSTVEKSKLGFIESFIDNVDGYMTPTLDDCEHDFDISDIDDAMRNNNHDEDRTHIDEDSLESCDGVIETLKESIASPRSIISDMEPILSNVKPGAICTALYLAHKQKQASNYKKSPSAFSYSRSNTLPNVIEALKKEEQQLNKPHRKLSTVTQRSQSIELFDKNPMNDPSRLDRDSGFDEQDFRCERSHSSYDDNSSLSSVKSVRSSIARSVSSDLNGQSYRENKAYELRVKALDNTRLLNEQYVQDARLNARKNFRYPTARTNNTVLPTTHKYKKNSQPNFYLKRQEL